MPLIEDYEKIAFFTIKDGCSPEDMIAEIHAAKAYWLAEQDISEETHEIPVMPTGWARITSMGRDLKIALNLNATWES